MSHWFDNTLQHLQVGEALITGGVENLFRGWHASSTDVIGKLHAVGAERWQAAIRQMQATVNLVEVNLVEILRARTLG
jgi:hypothetical protein